MFDVLKSAPIKGAIPMSDDKLLSTSEAADYLGVTPGYIRRLVRQQKLEAIQVNTYYVFRREELERWLANRPKRGRPYKQS